MLVSISSIFACDRKVPIAVLLIWAASGFLAAVVVMGFGGVERAHAQDTGYIPPGTQTTVEDGAVKYDTSDTSDETVTGGAKEDTESQEKCDPQTGKGCNYCGIVSYTEPDGTVRACSKSPKETNCQIRPGYQECAAYDLARDSGVSAGDAAGLPQRGQEITVPDVSGAQLQELGQAAQELDRVFQAETGFSSFSEGQQQFFDNVNPDALYDLSVSVPESFTSSFTPTPQLPSYLQMNAGLPDSGQFFVDTTNLTPTQQGTLQQTSQEVANYGRLPSSGNTFTTQYDPAGARQPLTEAAFPGLYGDNSNAFPSPSSAFTTIDASQVLSSSGINDAYIFAGDEVWQWQDGTIQRVTGAQLSAVGRDLFGQPGGPGTPPRPPEGAVAGFYPPGTQIPEDQQQIDEAFEDFFSEQQAAQPETQAGTGDTADTSGIEVVADTPLPGTTVVEDPNTLTNFVQRYQEDPVAATQELARSWAASTRQAYLELTGQASALANNLRTQGRDFVSGLLGEDEQGALEGIPTVGTGDVLDVASGERTAGDVVDEATAGAQEQGGILGGLQRLANNVYSLGERALTGVGQLFGGTPAVAQPSQGSYLENWTGEDVQTGEISWYGPNFDGRPTASGLVYDQNNSYMAASERHPVGTVLKVTTGEGDNARTTYVAVVDTGSFDQKYDRLLDGSRGLAERHGYLNSGVTNATVEAVAVVEGSQTGIIADDARAALDVAESMTAGQSFAEAAQSSGARQLAVANNIEGVRVAGAPIADVPPPAQRPDSDGVQTVQPVFAGLGGTRSIGSTGDTTPQPVDVSGPPEVTSASLFNPAREAGVVDTDIVRPGDFEGVPLDERRTRFFDWDEPASSPAIADTTNLPEPEINLPAPVAQNDTIDGLYTRASEARATGDTDQALEYERNANQLTAYYDRMQQDAQTIYEYERDRNFLDTTREFVFGEPGRIAQARDRLTQTQQQVDQFVPQVREDLGLPASTAGGDSQTPPARVGDIGGTVSPAQNAGEPSAPRSRVPDELPELQLVDTSNTGGIEKEPPALAQIPREEPPALAQFSESQSAGDSVPLPQQRPSPLDRLADNLEREGKIPAGSQIEQADDGSITIRTPDGETLALEQTGSEEVTLDKQDRYSVGDLKRIAEETGDSRIEQLLQGAGRMGDNRYVSRELLGPLARATSKCNADPGCTVPQITGLDNEGAIGVDRASPFDPNYNPGSKHIGGDAVDYSVRSWTPGYRKFQEYLHGEGLRTPAALCHGTGCHLHVETGNTTDTSPLTIGNDQYGLVDTAGTKVADLSSEEYVFVQRSGGTVSGNTPSTFQAPDPFLVAGSSGDTSVLPEPRSGLTSNYASFVTKSPTQYTSLQPGETVFPMSSVSDRGSAPTAPNVTLSGLWNAQRAEQLSSDPTTGGIPPLPEQSGPIITNLERPQLSGSELTITNLESPTIFEPEPPALAQIDYSAEPQPLDSQQTDAPTQTADSGDFAWYKPWTWLRDDDGSFGGPGATVVDPGGGTDISNEPPGTVGGGSPGGQFAQDTGVPADVLTQQEQDAAIRNAPRIDAQDVPATPAQPVAPTPAETGPSPTPISAQTAPTIRAEAPSIDTIAPEPGTPAISETPERAPEFNSADNADVPTRQPATDNANLPEPEINLPAAVAQNDTVAELYLRAGEARDAGNEELASQYESTASELTGRYESAQRAANTLFEHEQTQREMDAARPSWLQNDSFIGGLFYSEPSHITQARERLAQAEQEAAQFEANVQADLGLASQQDPTTPTTPPPPEQVSVSGTRVPNDLPPLGFVGSTNFNTANPPPGDGSALPGSPASPIGGSSETLEQAVEDNLGIVPPTGVDAVQAPPNSASQPPPLGEDTGFVPQSVREAQQAEQERIAAQQAQRAQQLQQQSQQLMDVDSQGRDQTPSLDPGDTGAMPIPPQTTELTQQATEADRQPSLLQRVGDWWRRNISGTAVENMIAPADSRVGDIGGTVTPPENFGDPSTPPTQSAPSPSVTSERPGEGSTAPIERVADAGSTAAPAPTPRQAAPTVPEQRGTFTPDSSPGTDTGSARDTGAGADDTGDTTTRTPTPDRQVTPSTPPPSSRTSTLGRIGSNVGTGAQALLKNLQSLLGLGGQPQPQSGGGAPSAPSAPPSTGTPSTPNTPTGSKPPQLSCSSGAVVSDGSASVEISWTCQGATGSRGIGDTFNTGGGASGTRTVQRTDTSSNRLPANLEYGVECISGSNVVGRRTCTVPVLRPSVSLIAAPSEVQSGERVQLTWSSIDTLQCLIGAGGGEVLTIAGKNGNVESPALARATEFVAICATNARTTHTAKVLVSVTDDNREPLRVSTNSIENAAAGVIEATGSSSVPATQGTGSTGTNQQPLGGSGFTGVDAQGNTVQLCDPGLGLDRFTQCLVSNN